MKLRLVTIGGRAPTWADDAVADYAKRLTRWGGLEQINLKPARFAGDIDAVREAESVSLLASISPRDRLIVLDERGDALTTEAFSALLAERLADTPGAVVFAIGGPYGHAPATRKAAAHVLRLSKLVVNHQIARVLLVEQLYRAMTLHHGIPYHH